MPIFTFFSRPRSRGTPRPGPRASGARSRRSLPRIPRSRSSQAPVRALRSLRRSLSRKHTSPAHPISGRETGCGTREGPPLSSQTLPRRPRETSASRECRSRSKGPGRAGGAEARSRASRDPRTMRPQARGGPRVRDPDGDPWEAARGRRAAGERATGQDLSEEPVHLRHRPLVCAPRRGRGLLDEFLEREARFFTRQKDRLLEGRVDGEERRLFGLERADSILADGREAFQERPRLACAHLPEQRLLTPEDVLHGKAELSKDARRGRRHERHEGPRNDHGRNDSGPRKERPALGPVRDLSRAQDRRGDREKRGGGERPRERRERRQPRAAREALDDFLGFERPLESLERKARTRLEKEKALAADAREERQGGGVGRDLERVARGLERRAALPEELFHLGPFAHESTRERHEGWLVGGVGRVENGHRAVEEPRERRRERLEEGLSSMRGRQRYDGRLVRWLREPRDLHEIVVLGRAP